MSGRTVTPTNATSTRDSTTVTFIPFSPGWFTQSDEPHCRKEYKYQFNVHNTNYVEWHERETRGAVVKERLSLVYVARAYLSAVSVTEKRNLIWDLRLAYCTIKC